MAAATAAVLLFLFTFSSAYSPLDQPKRLIGLPDSDPKHGAAILLPTERPESEAPTSPEETKLTDSKEISVSVSDSQTDSIPLTTILTLRPVNRRFYRLPLFPIRRGFKCHGHHRRHQIHQLRQRFAGRREISYGNDMLVAKGEDRGFEPAKSGERWAKYNHGGGRFSLINDDTIRQEMYRLSHARPHFHHHHRRHRRHHRDEDEEEEEEDNRHDHERGIMSKIRKFLNF